jgi:hypothetical protein
MDDQNTAINVDELIDNLFKTLKATAGQAQEKKSRNMSLVSQVSGRSCRSMFYKPFI